MVELQLPTMSSLVSFYASLSTIAMIIRTILTEMIPESVQEFISRKLSDFFAAYLSRDFVFEIEDRWEAVDNQTFRAVQAYLPTKTSASPSTRSLLLGHNDNNNLLAPPLHGISPFTKIVDNFQGMRMEWTLHQKETKNLYYTSKTRWFQLRCRANNKDTVLDTYIPHICRTSENIFKERETLCICTYNREESEWESTVFKHSATFDTLAMEPEQKQGIIDDLDLFLQRKDFFRSVGRAWKRGYLLYGPPGTGKSTLVAAIANYLRFHIYDLQLQGIRNDSELRRVLMATANRSILLIEDVDCSSNSTRPRVEEEDAYGNRRDQKNKRHGDGVTLSGLLNFIDGLWSSWGDERIIIFTTNHKEKLDPALLRPGRMDVHVYMGHCTAAGFRLLAAKYLGIEDHEHYKRIEELIEKNEVTPAEVAQQLMKSDKPQVALDSVILFLTEKDEAGKKTKGGGGGLRGNEIVGTVQESQGDQKQVIAAL